MADYVDKHLFTPLGITDYSFDETATGLTRASWGMKLRSRDMLKLGILALNEGEFNGKRIISADWVQKTNKKHADGGNFKYGYGYFWWSHTISYKNKQYEFNFCWGAYGQFIIVIPRLNSVAVFTSNGTQKGFSVLEKVIIPAMVHNN